MEYYLKSNGQRVVVGTADDFESLASQPRPERGYEDLVPPVQADNWQDAKERLLAMYQRG